MDVKGSVPPSPTRRGLLRAAVKQFAQHGYAAASVSGIVNDAKVSKPALYYYFTDKAGLFRAVLEEVHEERYQLMRKAALRGGTTEQKLVEILAAVFEHALRKRALMRLAFATAFAAEGEAFHRQVCLEKGRRSFEFFQSLIEEGQARGELNRGLDPEEVTMGIYGQLMSYVMVRLLVPDRPLDRQTARQIVRLFMRGASAQNERVARAAGRS